MAGKEKEKKVAGTNEPGFHDVGGRLPLIQVREEVGQTTRGVFISRKTVNVKRGKKQEDVLVVHATVEGEEVEFFAPGLLGWLFAEEQGVKENDEFILTYKGLEHPEKKPGLKNRHQYRLQVKD